MTAKAPRATPASYCFGYKVTPLSKSELLATVSKHVAEREQCVMAHLNLHAMHVRDQTPGMLELHERSSTYVFIDGMPLVFLARLAGIRASRAQRVTAVDFIWPLLELADANGWRVYYVGSSPPVLAVAERRILERLPSLNFRCHHGYLGANEVEVTEQIAEFGADLVLVGMGTPLQELWCLRNSSAIAPASIVPCGAVMEFVAETAPTPPRWSGQWGLEGIFRLASDPRRFWRRYLIEPWAVLRSIIVYTIRGARHGLP